MRIGFMPMLAGASAPRGPFVQEISGACVAIKRNRAFTGRFLVRGVWPFRPGCAVVLLALGTSLMLRAETPLAETRSRLEKWVETRQLIAKSRSDWQRDKETIEQTLHLYERELKLVDEQLASVETNSVQVAKERLDGESLRDASNESLNRTREFAAGFEAELARLVPRLPVPLRDILKPLLNRLPTEPAATRASGTDRAQTIVGILNELDKFNNAVSVFSEKRKNDKGEELAVETVYVGLGAAYFVNEANDFAGMGTPGASGWEWTIDSALVQPVREAVRIYRNERPARFVALPAVIR